MINLKLEIQNKLGLHARPSSLFVELTGKFSSDIKVSINDFTVDGKSIIGLLMLAAPCKTILDIQINGEDEQALAHALTQLFESKFDEV